MAAAGNGNWVQYHDYSQATVDSSEVSKDLPKDPEAKRKLKLINDGIAQNLKYQGVLFKVIIGIVVVSLVSILVVNSCAAMWGTHLDASVLISFNASIAVQSFILLGVIARSLFPAPRTVKDDGAESA